MRVRARLLGVERTVVEDVEFDEEALVVAVPGRRERRRCGICRRHGVVVAAVPWARHGSRFTRSFEDQVAWLACQCSKWAVSELMGSPG